MPKRFRFGLYEFDAATRELRREGALVRLQSQPAKALACLLEQSGQVVSRNDLRKALWDNDTFVDFDQSLNFCISQVRSALKDDSAEPVFIRTIPKLGYQFIAPVQQLVESSPDQKEISAVPRRFVARPVVLASAAGILFVCVLLVGYRFFRFRSPGRPPIVAIARFDNETGNAGLDRFSDALTDTVVEQLASMSRDRYQVIGNTQILRLPRDQRDLKGIASSLHAVYVVLGQVQSNGDQIRILAHLIRLSDQTHLWVVRTERTLTDPLSLESDVAQRIASEFSARVSSDAHRPASLPVVTH